MREVEEQSQKIAEAQGNPEFFVSNNWLTRLENTSAVPSIHKLFSSSAVYRVRVSELLPMFGINQRLLEKYQIETAPSVLSGMIGIHLEVGEQERFAAGLLTSALRLQRDKDSVDLRERLGVVKLQHPSFL